MWSRSLTAALLLCAPPVSADVIKIAAPRFWPVSAPPHRADPTVPGCVGACELNYQYFGGGVLANVKVYAVFWDDTVSPDITAGIGGFYQTLTNSQWMDWLTEYSTTLNVQAGSDAGKPGTQQVIGRGTFAGSYTLGPLSQTYPAYCGNFFAGTSGLTCVEDTDIQNELIFQIGNHHLPPPDGNTLYMVHFPASVQISIANPPASSCQDFCAYHSSLQTHRLGGVLLYYAVIPDLGSDGCQFGGCGTGTIFENTCSAASHEVAESITDAMNNATAPTDYPLAWYDNEANSQGELADVCDQQNDTLDVNGVPGCGAADAGCYTVQQVFSRVVWNADPADQPNVAACVASRFDADDYSIALSPNTLTLVRGVATAVVPVVTTLTNGNPLPLTLSAEAPPGLHASFDNPTPMVGGAVNLTISSDVDAPLVQDGVLAVQATGTATHSAALLVHLLPQNAWNLVLSPATALLFPGGSQTYTIDGNVTAGSAEPVSLSAAVSGLPPGVNATFSALTLTPGASTALVTLSVSPDAPGAPSTPFSVTGVSASQPEGHHSLASIQVDNPPNISIVTPAAGATVSNYQLVSVVANPGVNSSVRTINITLDDDVELSIGSAFTFLWNTEEAANGSHTLHVRTFDADGAGGSALVTVTVANASSGGCASSNAARPAPGLSLLLGMLVWARRCSSRGNQTAPSRLNASSPQESASTAPTTHGARG